MQSRHSTQVIDFSLTFHVYLLLTQKNVKKFIFLNDLSILTTGIIRLSAEPRI